MPIRTIIIASMLIALLPLPNAHAFTIDPQSNTNSDGSARYSDPDDQVHSLFFGHFGSTGDNGYVRDNSSRNAFPMPGALDQGQRTPGLPGAPRLLLGQ
jgi:hypothetical protein